MVIQIHSNLDTYLFKFILKYQVIIILKLKNMSTFSWFNNKNIML